VKDEDEDNWILNTPLATTNVAVGDDGAGVEPQNTVPQARNDNHTRDACGHMADVAQQQANRALRANGNNPSRALAAFDRGFSRLYAGRSMASVRDIAHLAYYGPVGRTINPYYFGETGFKQGFMDTDPDNVSHHANADQTHHFTAMFSAGINTTGLNWISSTLHNINDNDGDVRLTNAAYDLGTALAGNPNNLRNIGSLIRSSICDRAMRGRNL
jgi:hypothetical protein